MLKLGQKNNYQEFLRKKKKFAKKVKAGKKFKDSDYDGLSDYEEKYLYGTDPKNPDTDSDGMKDGDEIKLGRNPLGPGRFKNLFIPHAGNNYLPHVLKPKRLLFHALSAVAIKAIVVIFILFYPISAWLSPELALVQAKKIIELTNGLRQTISLPALLESHELTQAALEKVSDMALNNYFAHISPAGRGLANWLQKIGYKYSLAGENLAVGFSRPEDVVAAWKNSPTHYDNIINRDFKEIGVAVADGKFNQVDTAFIAQYFARPLTPERSDGQAAAVSQTPGTKIPGEKVSILEIAQAPKVSVKKPAEKEIALDQQKAVLTIKSGPLDREKAVQIETILPKNISSAEVVINNKKIILDKVLEKPDSWRGVSLISLAEEKNILNPLIPASISATNSTGTVLSGKIDWDEIKIIKATPLEHYQLFKSRPAAGLAPVMSLSSLYFKLILAIALIALLLNIFIEIKKQHPHIIFYSFAFIGLLAAMIIF